MRRLLAAAGAAVLTLAVVPAARAVPADGQDHKLTFYTPVKYPPPNYTQQNQPATAPDNAAVYNKDEIVTVKADFVDGVKSWDVRLVPQSGGAASSCHEDIAPQNGSYPGVVYILCPWDTTRAVDRTLDQATPAGEVGNQNFSRNWHLSDHGPSVNGKYTIEVTVTNAGRSAGLTFPAIQGDQKFTLFEPNTNPPRWRQVWVTNGVADPTGVNNAYDGGTGRVRVTWAPNPEPDVSYVVQEKVNDGKWGGGGQVPGTATSYERAIDQPGKYQYRVQAVRPAPTGDGSTATKQSAWVATAAAEIAQVAPPTTAGGAVAGPDGSPDGGDPGVSMPTDTPPSTAGKPGSHITAPGKGSPTTGRTSGGSSGFHPTGSSAGSGGAGGGGEEEGEGPDEGFSTALPYEDKSQEGFEDGLGEGESADSVIPGVTVPKPADTRQLLICMAAGLAIFVLAMQMTVLVRRRPAMAMAEDDFDEWMGF